MPKRPRPQQPAIEPRQWTSAEDINRGIAKLNRRVAELEALDIREAVLQDTGRDDVAMSNVRETIREVFGPNSSEFDEHQYIRMRAGPMVVGISKAQIISGKEQGRNQVVGILQGLIGRLEEKREDLEPNQNPTIQPGASRPSTRRVFVVHGRDEGAKEAVSRFLDKLELEPVILHEQPNKGRTIIEKFEGTATVDFAVVLLTPDDIGHRADASDPPKHRARQNVIFELGYFVGSLGRSRVCALHKGGVEILSDFEGVIYVSMDDAQGWRLHLAREIKAAGIDVDLNRAL